jgi:hypothetical protein
MERQTQLEEEDKIIGKWAQEDVNTLYNLLNNNNNNFKSKYFICYVIGIRLQVFFKVLGIRYTT